MNNNQVYGPVKCPHCGSTHIEFVTEYHKCIWLRLLVAILVVIMSIFLVRYLIAEIGGADSSDEMQRLVIFAVLYVLFQLAVWITESKTHIQGICRDCGNIWLLN